ncbi:hypothetical protein PGB90_009264 [Kerria lacca]
MRTFFIFIFILQLLLLSMNYVNGQDLQNPYHGKFYYDGDCEDECHQGCYRYDSGYICYSGGTCQRVSRRTEQCWCYGSTRQC